MTTQQENAFRTRILRARTIEECRAVIKEAQAMEEMPPSLAMELEQPTRILEALLLFGNVAG